MLLSRKLVLSLAAAVCALLVTGCDGSSNNNSNSSAAQPTPTPDPGPVFSADIVWTEYGIPHITAEDWGSLGYGTGYAFARENFCTGMRGYVVARGETARYFGEEGNLEQDFVWKLLNSDDRIQGMLDSVSNDLRDMIEGYAMGINRYLADTGAANLPAECRDAAWVREVDSSDVMRVIHRLVLFASGEALLPFIAAAPEPPETGENVTHMLHPDAQEQIAAISPERFNSTVDLPQNQEYGSNGYAVGGESTQSGYGVLLSNPHLPWDIPLQYFMARQTLVGEMDVLGVTLFGSPAIGIGFNQNVGWGVTVSTGTRFNLYELTLNPENPVQYLFDGEARDLVPVTVSAEQMIDGGVDTVERTFYESQFGPVVDLGAVSPLLGGWPNAVGTLLVYRDANLGNARTLDQWLDYARAANVGEIKEATRSLGQPFLNTLATDRFGDAFYGNVSVTANIVDAQFTGCVRGFLQNQLTAFGLLTFDGSDSFCEWGSDEGAPDGLFSFDSMPKLDTRDYAANSNDSHWLANPRNLLEGFPMSIGLERVEQNLRPRHAFDQAERRLAGTDGLGEAGFNVDNIRSIMYSAENYTAELVLDDVVALCDAVADWSVYSESPDNAVQACEILGSWDRAHRLDSVGAHIFWEFWQLFSLTENIWAVPFDEADPINTPRDLNEDNDAVVEAVKTSLAAAADELVQAGIALDARWGDIQYVSRNDERFGLPGGDESMMFSVIMGPLVQGEGYSDIELGNSFIQAVTWDESECPDAYGVLTYSQSTNPESPHFADSTELYSQGNWIDLPFCSEDVEAAEIERMSISE